MRGEATHPTYCAEWRFRLPLGFQAAFYCADVNALPETLLHNVLQDGDVVLTMGAGSINRVAQGLVDLAQ